MKAQPSVKRPRSALRPMVVGAAALALIVATAGTLLACWGPVAVADAVSENSRRRAVTQATEGAHAAAVSGAVHVADVLRRAQTAADRISAVVKSELAATDADAPRASAEFVPLGGTELVWQPLDDGGVYVVRGAVAADDVEAADRAARLAGLARRLSPFLRAPVDADEGVVHVAVWLDGLGLVGAAPPSARTKIASRLATAGPGATALTGGADCGAGWLAPGERLAPERVISCVATVPADSPESRAAAVVTVDVSCAGVQTTISRHAARHKAAAAVVTQAGDVVVQTSDLADRLAVPRDDRKIVAALRGIVGNATVREAPVEGADFDRPEAIATAAGVPALGWTVVAVMPPAARIAAFTDGAVGAEQAARRQAIGFVALSLLFGGAVALGAFSLADSFRRRLRPILDGAAAHARGELSHVVDASDDDELGELAMSLNATATRLRQNLGRFQESERRLLNLIESMGEGFVIADVEDRVVFVNQRFLEMVKRPSSVIVGRYVEELLVPESVERYRGESAWRKEGRTGTYEVAWQTAGDKPARTIVSAAPMYDAGGGYTGSSAVVTDVTDRMMAQEERARTDKLRALGEMAGGVAHDFNNLLTVMLGNTQLLLMEDLPPEAKKTLSAIEEAALECGQRVRRVTEFTKSREVGTDAADVDPNALVVEALAVTKARRAPDAARRGVAYRVETRRGSRRIVRGDARELRNAVVSLLDNSFDAMEKGGRLVVETSDRGDDEVALRVEDDGVGMDDYVREKAFDPFFSTKHPGRCAGLGLSTVQEIVKAHGGRVEVTSASGKGSTFTIVLPTRRRGSSVGDAARPDGAEPPRPRVLLAGLADADVVQRGLRGLGIHVASVGSAQAALAILSDEEVFNTLVVEHDYGPSGGWSLAEAARAARRDVRIVLLAPAESVVEADEARAVGIDRVVRRPFDMRDLRAAVFSLLVAAPAGAEDGGAPGDAPATTTQGESSESWGAAAAQASGAAIPMRNA